MDGATVVYQLLSGYAGVTALVGSEIHTDDAITLPTGRSGIQIETVSSIDRPVVDHGASVFSQQRIRIRMQTVSAADRAALRAQVRKAIFANRFPVLSGLSNIVVELTSEGPDGLAPESDMRVGLIDVFVTYNEDR